jgi:hypothetical protein
MLTTPTYSQRAHARKKHANPQNPYKTVMVASLEHHPDESASTLLYDSWHVNSLYSILPSLKAVAETTDFQGTARATAQGTEGLTMNAALASRHSLSPGCMDCISSSDKSRSTVCFRGSLLAVKGRRVKPVRFACFGRKSVKQTRNRPLALRWIASGQTMNVPSSRATAYSNQV